MSSCPRCRRPIDETDCYCRHCGTLWLSHKLSLRAKWGWTAAIVLFSAYFIYALYRSFLLIQEALSYALPAGL